MREGSEALPQQLMSCRVRLSPECALIDTAGSSEVCGNEIEVAGEVVSKY